MSLPIRRNKFDLEGFTAFLTSNGCEVGKPSNAYEVVRYRAYWDGSKKPVTHIVYAKQTGILNWMQGTQAHYRAFLEGRAIARNKSPFVSQFDGRAPVTAPPPRKSAKSKSEITRARLMERDGPDCWFCGKVMGDDCTIEHLVPKSKGGRNMPDNYALAHSKCNSDAAALPLVKKIEMRARLRGVPA